MALALCLAATPGLSGVALAAEEAPEAVPCNDDLSPGAQVVIEACTADMDSWPQSDTKFQAWLRLRRANALLTLNRGDEALADLDEAVTLDPELAYAYLVRARLLMIRGDRTRGRQDVDRAIALDPEIATAWLLRANLNLIEKQFDAAEADASRALEASDGEEIQVYEIRGYVRLQKGDYPGAIADLTRVLQEKPEDVRLLRRRAGAYVATGEFQKAIADLTVVVRTTPDDPTAYFERSVVYMQIDVYTHMTPENGGLAIADLNAALKLKPDYVWAYQNRSIIYLRLGQIDLALADAETLQQMPPDAVLGLNQRGFILNEAGRKAEARAAFDASLKIRPTAVAFAGRAQSFGAEEEDQRLADLTSALALDPEFGLARGLRARLYARRKAYDLALADADLALAKFPEDIDALMARAMTFDGLDDTPKLLLALDRLVEAAQPSPSLFNWRCWTLATTGGDLDRALADCEQAVSLSPKQAGYLDSRGMVHLQAGRYDLAIKDYDAALALKPDLAASLYGRGMARLRKGQTAEGRADLSAAGAIDPGIAARFAAYRLIP
ncbi:MAG: tetratricopeptide repeat protein [Caulobacter sp.]|nr:tetratricopeptide repeat protein [Caulobacter sp.]